jgi:DNA-binding transcriptional LysR family regulator
MITFKQIEALYWIAKLGSHEAAAEKLYMSQSAISKRILELEESFDIKIFDRTHRSARLTEKGQELLDYATELLERRDSIIERISSRQVLVKRFRLGVTELTAMTWLPALIDATHKRYPRVQIEPSVELSSTLVEQLADDRFDLVIIPDFMRDSRFLTRKVGVVENAWMCAPRLIAGDTINSTTDLVKYPLLIQGSDSGTGCIYGRWLSELNHPNLDIIMCNNLIAQIGFAIAGLGIGYLPVAYTAPLVKLSRLIRVETAEALPEVDYIAVYRSDRVLGLSADIADLAAQCCNFSQSWFEA